MINSASPNSIDWKYVNSAVYNFNQAFTYNNLIGKTNRTEVYHVTLNKQF